MKTIYDWLDAYGESHQNQINKKIHWICVPIIMLSLLGLLSLIEFNFAKYYNINLAGILIILAIIFYIRLSISITVGMVLLSGWCIQIINTLEYSYDSYELFKIYTIAFIIAWIGQFIGHKIEGKKPSFFDDLKFLLIGPAWLLSFIYKKLGIKY